MSVTPYKDENRSKKEQVADMFDNISGKYDFLNRFLSLGIDKIWRRNAIAQLKEIKPQHILDLATGTGDVAIAALKLKPKKITAADISEGMMDVGRSKIKKMGKDDIISFQYGDSENLPFEDNTFDAITIAFGVRNFENLEKGLSDMLRVLKPGGKAVILEFSKPKRFPIKQTFGLYSRYFIPKVGKAISKDDAAYAYLPESVAAFPEGKDFADILEKIGYKNVYLKPQTGGISTIYCGKK
ncbi:MAG: bifunctional demethylmenaquinone methyltransferase/2-methoxy-6-polyprenyl-1,4-benzoquinol methylase UbiE [Flavobacteriales bacterium]